MAVIRKAVHVSIKTADGIRSRQRFQGPILKMSTASIPTEKQMSQVVNIYYRIAQAARSREQKPLSKECLFWPGLITIKQESCQRRDVY